MIENNEILQYLYEMKTEMNAIFDRMDKKFEDMKKYIDIKFSTLESNLIEIKQSLAVMEKDHGDKLQLLLKTRNDIIEKEVENSIRIDFLKERVEILEYKELKI